MPSPPRVEPGSPAPSSPSSGGAQTLVCPHCQGAIRARQVEAGHQLRCSSCRGLLGGPPTGPVQWLYPVRRRPDSSSSGPRATSPDPHATGATLDLGGTETGGAAPRHVGRYELREELGRGGMGVVYAAWDQELRREVALKVLLSGGFASPEARTRFVGEARAAAGLHHVHIVRVFDMGEVEGQPWFAMERVFGPSLEEILATGGALEIDEATRIGVAVAEAVAHAHAAGVAHRDLKPGNVLLDGDGHPRITDFGLARQLEEAQHLTATHHVLGTPSYMPPEVARGEAGIDWTRADVFGLGGVLYAALTGRPPVEGATLNQRLEAAARGDHHAPRRLRPEVPPALDAIVGKALHPDPASRYPHAAALAADLRRFRAGEPVAARPDTPVERLGRWSRRHARSLGIAGGVTVAVVVAAAWAPVQTALATRQREAAADSAWAGIEAGLDTPDGADRLLAFVESEQYRGTSAVARAWLRRGDDLARLPHPHGELGRASDAHVQAWARALTESTDATIRAASLVRLARAAMTRSAYTDVEALLLALAELPEGSVADAERVPIELAAALNAGDRPRAAAAWDRAVTLGLPEAAKYEDPRWLPGAFRGATRIVGTLPDDELTDPRDPAGPAVVHFGDRTVSRIELVPTVRVSAAAPFPGPREYVPIGVRPVRIWGPDGLVAHPPGSDRAWGDVDGDGVEEGYEWHERVLYRLAPDGLSREPILPEVRRTDSELTHAVADLDGDGRDELVVALSEWRAYDLRVYEYADGQYRLRARVRTNDTVGLATLPDPWGKGRLIVTSEDDHYSNGNRHGIDTPDGPAPGIRVRRLVGDHLEEIYRLGREEGFGDPTGPGWPRTVLAADVDGDGGEEIVGSAGELALVLRPGEAPGTFRLAAFPSPTVIAARQLDDDPETELVATQWADYPSPGLWILGRGDQQVPRAAPPPASVPLLPPEGALDGPLAAVWRDALVLTRANQDDSAAALLLRAATVGKDPDLAAGAAGLWQALDRRASAAEAMELAARSSPAGPVAEGRWGDAVDLWLEAADPAAALEAADRWRASGAGPSGERAERLAVWEAARKGVVGLTPGEVPDDRWEVLEPLAVDLRPRETVLHLLGSATPVVRAPVTPTGGGIALLVDGVVDPSETAVALTLAPKLGFVVTRFGQDKSGALVGRCGWRGLLESDTVRLPPAGSTTPPAVPIRLRMTWTPTDATWRCAITLPDQGQAGFDTQVGPVPKGLAIEVGSGERWGQWTGFTVQRLELWGVRPTDRTLTAVDRANHAMLQQDPAATLALLPDDATLERAVAYAQLRRAPEAIELFRRAFLENPGALMRRLPYLVRLHRETFAPLIRPAVGDRWPALMDGVLHRPIRHIHAPPGVDEALRIELEGVPFPRDPEDPGWCILADRVGALVRGPAPARGVEAGRAWLAAFEALHVPPDTEPWALASQVHRELAFEAAARGDRDAATAEAQASVDASPTPVSAVDRVWVSPIWQAAGLPLPVARPRD